MLKLQKARNIYITNAQAFIFALIIMYFPASAFLSSLLPETFYTFSVLHSRSLIRVYWSFPLVLLIFYVALSWNKWICRQDVFTKLLRQCGKMCFCIAIIQWGLIIIVGLYARIIMGLDRGDLLGLEHHFLISGTSFVYVFAFVYATRFLKPRHFLYLILAFVSIDLIYMGKKYIFYLIALFLFRVDSHALVKSIKPVVFSLLGGAGFVLVIFFIRAAAAGSAGLLSMYALFSEFIGVVSTVGFAMEYGPYIDGFWKVISKLEPFYLNSVGHGLALHPVAYFIVVGGDYWFLSLLAYLLVFLMFFYFFSMVLGDLALLVLLLNIIHFFRHGPDIFMFQFMTQAFVLMIVMYAGLLKQKNQKSVNTTSIKGR